MDVDLDEAGPSSVKDEPGIDEEVCEKILELCMAKEKGVLNKELERQLPNVTPEQRGKAINTLLANEKIEMMKKGTELLFRIKDPTANKGTDDEERLVYTQIELAGNKGIWYRDIRTKTNLNEKRLKKVISALEGRKVIKAIKHVKASRKKIYMLYDLEPDRSVTGGTWYGTEHEFEGEFVKILLEQVLRFLELKGNEAEERYPEDPVEKYQASFVSSDAVLKYINESKISTVTLSSEDIETILALTLYDGLAEKQTQAVKDSEGVRAQSTYRYIGPPYQLSGIVRTPCGVCPVRSDCHEGGAINPLNCIYLEEWF